MPHALRTDTTQQLNGNSSQVVRTGRTAVFSEESPASLRLLIGHCRRSAHPAKTAVVAHIADCAVVSKFRATQFCVNGEQADGAVKFDGEHYLIEAWW